MFALVLCVLILHLAQVDSFACDISPHQSWIQQEIVDIHNKFRREVIPTASDMLLMNYSTEIGAVAQAWVNNCILAHGPPSSRMLNGYQMGENLFYSSSLLSWSEVITSWHSEVEHYQYPNISTSEDSIGHYTQVVWSTSYKVGCGMKKCKDTYFYGCHYFRAGNFMGWPPYTVGRPCGSCRNKCVNKLCTNPCPFVNGFSNCAQISKQYGCNYPRMKTTCLASCNCTSEIIPIG